MTDSARLLRTAGIMNIPETTGRFTNRPISSSWPIYLAIFAVSLLAGTAIGYYVLPQMMLTKEPKAKYVLAFGDGAQRVKINLASLANFEIAIDSNHARWRRDISINDGSTAPAKTYPDFGTDDPNPITVSRAAIIQQNKTDGSPCTMHVTQRVGLNGQDDVKSILSMLDTDYPP